MRVSKFPKTALQHHKLSNGSYKDELHSAVRQKIKKLINSGYMGYSVASASDRELNIIRKWAKTKSKDIYITKNDYFADGDEYYWNVCIGIWMPPKYFDDFLILLEGLINQAKQRIHYMIFDYTTPEKIIEEIKHEYSKIKHKLNVRLIYLNDIKDELALEFDNDPEFLGMKLKWSEYESKTMLD